MWYECLPPFAIIIGAMYLAGKGVGLVDKLANGGKVGHSDIVLCSVIFPSELIYLACNF